MKFSITPQHLWTLSLFVLLYSGTSTPLVAQEDVAVKLANFTIRLETSADEIKLTCSEGCAWKELSFSTSQKSDPQAIDPNGMTSWPRNQTHKDASLPDFLFTIKRTKEGVSLEGKEGVMWPSLTFDCAGGQCIRSFDQYGMINADKRH